MSKKTGGWENRLISYLSRCSTTPFRPGKMDCALFFAGAAKAMTGDDIARGLRGKYRTIEGGQKIIQDRGFKDHVDYITSFYPARPSIMMAQRGDGVVITDMDGNEAIGVVQGEHVYVMGLSGLGTVPLIEAKRAFEV